MTMPDSQRYPWNLYLINYLEVIFVFQGLKVFNSCMLSCSRNARVCWELTVANNQFWRLQIFIFNSSDKPFKGTDVYQTLPSLHRGSFEITLTVPVKILFTKNERRYRLTAKNNCFWSLLFIFLSVAPIKRKLLKNDLYSRT